MIEKLDEALDKLDGEPPPPADMVDEACNQLTALFTQIIKLINERWLDTDEAEPLLNILIPIMTDPDVECPVPTE